MSLQALGADWIVASGHKMCAPTGVGFLWGRYDLLEAMPPWQGGGEMIEDVFLDHSTYSPPPTRFEAGTPAIGEVIGLGAAVDYIESIGGMAAVHAHEVELGGYLYEQLHTVEGVTIYGPAPDCEHGRAALASFNVAGLHATDVSMLLDAAGARRRLPARLLGPRRRVHGRAAVPRPPLPDSPLLPTPRVLRRAQPYRSARGPRVLDLAQSVAPRKGARAAARLRPRCAPAPARLQHPRGYRCRAALRPPLHAAAAPRARRRRVGACERLPVQQPQRRGRLRGGAERERRLLQGDVRMSGGCAKRAAATSVRC